MLASLNVCFTCLQISSKLINWRMRHWKPSVQQAVKGVDFLQPIKAAIVDVMDAKKKSKRTKSR